MGCAQDGCYSNTQFIDDPNYPAARPDTIEIGRVVTDSVNGDGSLQDTASLVANGVVSSTACVLVTAGVYGAIAPSFTLMLNDVAIWSWSLPQGNFDSTTQSTYVVEFPIRVLHFAQRSENGPITGKNRIYMTASHSIAAGCWGCGFNVHLGPITFKAMAPVVLVHGLRSGPWWWGDKDPNSASPCGPDRVYSQRDVLAKMGVAASWSGGFNFVGPLIDKKIPYDCKDVEIENIANFEKGAGILLQKVEAVMQAFGAKHVHIVAHSAGGDWTRQMLASSAFENSGIGVYSVTTLSTPFSGSVLADFAVAGKKYPRFIWKSMLPGNGSLAGFVGGAAHGESPLEEDLRTNVTPILNKKLDPSPLKTIAIFPDQPDGSSYPEPNDVKYFSIAANADRDNNWYIDATEGEGQEFADGRFQLLRKHDSVIVCPVNTVPCPPGQLFSRPQIQNSAVDHPNDTAVTVESAQWPGFTPIPDAKGNAYWLFNHKQIGNPEVAKAVLEKIRMAQPMSFGKE